jgi:hypothetical protein
VTWRSRAPSTGSRAWSTRRARTAASTCTPCQRRGGAARSCGAWSASPGPDARVGCVGCVGCAECVARAWLAACRLATRAAPPPPCGQTACVHTKARTSAAPEGESTRGLATVCGPAVHTVACGLVSETAGLAAPLSRGSCSPRPTSVRTRARPCPCVPAVLSADRLRRRRACKRVARASATSTSAAVDDASAPQGPAHVACGRGGATFGLEERALSGVRLVLANTWFWPDSGVCVFFR